MSGGGTIPATPLPGTADANPLVTWAQYKTITTDLVTVQATVEAAIVDAIEYVCLRCNRTLLYAQYTERVYIYRDGMAYPSAVPLDPAQPVGVGGVAGQGNVQGNGIWVGFFTPLANMPVWTGVVPPQTDVTYWGGYTQTTLPVRLRNLIAKVAYYQLHPFVASGMPALAQSVNTGGVSVSGDHSQMVLGDPQMRRDLERFKRRQARAW